jgi:hydrogenase/urease accessory protein HupE
VILVAATASAHDPFEVTTDAHVTGARLVMHTTMSLLTATRACMNRAPGARALEPEGFAGARPDIEACARAFYRLTAGGEPLPPLEVAVALAVEDDVDMTVAFPRPTQSPLVIEAPGLRPLVSRAGVVLTVTGARTFLGQTVLRPDDATFTIPITEEAESPGTPPVPSFGRFFALGVEHILTGYDHLLFLVGLLVVCRRFSTAAAIVTSFTVAHSITLALAALQVVALPSRVVELLIAGTIVLIGVENLARGEEPERPWVARWALAFVFGLVHGLGFASALRETGLGAPGTSLIVPIASFNLGVEAGQLAVAAVVLAVAWQLRRLPVFARHGPRAISLLVAGCGLVWLVERWRA